MDWCAELKNFVLRREIIWHTKCAWTIVVRLLRQIRKDEGRIEIGRGLRALSAWSAILAIRPTFVHSHRCESVRSGSLRRYCSVILSYECVGIVSDCRLFTSDGSWCGTQEWCSSDIHWQSNRSNGASSYETWWVFQSYWTIWTLVIRAPQYFSC